MSTAFFSRWFLEARKKFQGAPLIGSSVGLCAGCQLRKKCHSDAYTQVRSHQWVNQKRNEITRFSDSALQMRKPRAREAKWFAQDIHWVHAGLGVRLCLETWFSSVPRISVTEALSLQTAFTTPSPLSQLSEQRAWCSSQPFRKVSQHLRSGQTWFESFRWRWSLSLDHGSSVFPCLPSAEST